MATLEFLRESLPGFASLRRSVRWPGPLARALAARWMRRHGRSGSSGSIVRALRLVETSDREFCRRVHLDGWRDVADRERVRFQLLDDGELLWPVAARALVLFGGVDLTTGPGGVRRLVPPSAARVDDGAESSSDPSRFTARTVRSHAEGERRFTIVIRRQSETTETSSVL